MRADVEQGWGIVEFRGRDGLRRLEADWKRVAGAMPDRSPQHAYETNLAYFSRLKTPDADCTFLALTDGTTVRAICPLESGTLKILGLPTRVWGLPWNLHDLLRDVVCPPDEAERMFLPSLVRFLRAAPRRPGWVVFDRVLEGSALWRCLRGLDARAYCTDQTGASDVLNCGRSFDEVFAGFSQRFRRNLRAAYRKLTALPGVRFEHATDRRSLERELEVFLEIEASGWKGEAGSRGAILLKPDQLAYYRDLAALLGDLHQCEIDALYAQGRCVAAQFCLRFGPEYIILKIGYDERLARLSPGQLLIERTVERCCADPEIRRLGLVSHTEWVREWRPEVVPVHRVYVPLGRWSAPLLLSLLRLWFTRGRPVKQWLRSVARRPAAATAPKSPSAP
jgi:hypothetical protein